MSKRLITLGMALVMLFSLIGLCACENFDLAKYKTDAKAEIEAKAQSKWQVIYTEENWELVLGLVADGKAEVDKAGNKSAVDAAKTATIQLIKEVEMNFVEIETDSMVDCSKFHYVSFRSSSGAPIVLNHCDNTAVFECSVNQGMFYLQNSVDNTSKIELASGKGFWWIPAGENFDLSEAVFVNVVLRIDGKIIGYAVIEIYPSNSTGSDFYARCKKSALFPKIYDVFQNITENQVNALISKIKEEKLS